jgi:hypothetical protein
VIGGQNSSSLTLNAVAVADAGTYSVEVTGGCGSLTNFATLTVNPGTSATPLANLVRCTNQPATFSTVASGTGPFGFVWRKNGGVMAGQTNNSITINATGTNIGTYTVEVSGGCSSVTNSGTLSIGAAISATALTNRAICPCEYATFATTASGPGPFNYAWRIDGALVAGETTSSLTVQNCTTGAVSTITVEVTGSCNSITNSATLTVDTVVVANPITFSNPGYIAINDHNFATPYPSIINTKCIPGTVTKVTVTLYQVSHTFPDDIDLLLVSPSGQALTLMSDAGGGHSINGVNLTFDQMAPGLLPDSSQIVGGTYKPTDYESDAPWPLPAPQPSVGDMFAFNGTNTHGAWALYAVDDNDVDVGAIAGGWSLTFTWTGSALPPTLSEPAMLGNGQFQFTISGEANHPHLIQASSDLQNWASIGTNSLVGGTAVFVDTAAPGINPRFYRVIRLP